MRYKNIYEYQRICFIFLFSFLLISCGEDDNPTQNPLTVTGLTNNTTPRDTMTWNWDCKDNSGACTFRHAINKNATHAFTANDSFTSEKTKTKTVTSSSEDGTYYIHVQAKDSKTQSAIAKASAVFQYTSTTTDTLSVTGLTDDTTPRKSVTWNWNCQNNVGTCKYRHAMNQSATHAFTASDAFTSETTKTKAVTSSDEDGTYYIHVQAKDNNAQSSIAKASAVLQYTATTTPTDTLSVIGLADDTTPQASVTWTWNCQNNAGTCKYRHAVNESATHAFTASDAYTSETNETKTLTSSDEDGTYYIHVQAKDGNGESAIAKGSAVLEYTNALIVTGLTNDTTSKSSETWNWDCQNNSGTCTFRHVVNKDATHAFTASDAYTSEKTETKTITSSSDDAIYYIHVQAKDGNGESAVAKGSAVLNAMSVTGLTDDTTPKSSVTWNWDCQNNAGDCTYRHAVNKNATHNFTSSQTFTSEKTATKSLTSTSENDTYYVHVQAKDNNGQSSVAKASAVLEF